MSFQLNDPVTIKFTTLAGTVKGAAMDFATLQPLYLVEYTDQDGVEQQRYFKADELVAA